MTVKIQIDASSSSHEELETLTAAPGYDKFIKHIANNRDPAFDFVQYDFIPITNKVKPERLNKFTSIALDLFYFSVLAVTVFLRFFLRFLACYVVLVLATFWLVEEKVSFNQFTNGIHSETFVILSGLGSIVISFLKNDKIR